MFRCDIKRLFLPIMLFGFLLTPLVGIGNANAGAALKDKIFGETKQAGSESFRTDEAGEASLLRTVTRAIQAVLGILGVIAVIMVIYAGFLWLTAGGNTDRVGQAKKILKRAVIGILIIFFAYSLVAFALSALSKVQS